MTSAANTINTALTKSLHGYSISSIKVVDEALIQLRGEAPELNLAPNITLTVSLGVSKALAFTKGLPLYKCIA